MLEFRSVMLENMVTRSINFPVR